jgi:hypothetical protein
MRKLYIELGRNGDIVNILPLLWRNWCQKAPANLLVAKEYLPLTQGCTYFQAAVYPGAHNQPGAAEAWAKQNRHSEVPVVCQVENNPNDSRQLTDSYQKESWRLAGALDEFGRWPLVFDRRNTPRENALVSQIQKSKPMILFAGESISSPFPDAAPLLASLKYQFAEYDVIDLSGVRAQHIYDLIGLYQSAALLISVDTVHIHLARACHTPVIAIINNGWLGSIPPPTTVKSFRYTGADTGSVLMAASDVLYPSSRTIYHASDIFGQTERHKRARATWEPLFNYGVIPMHPSGIYPKDARAIGCARQLPYLKEIIRPAFDAALPDDVILFCNDDVGLNADIIPWARAHVGTYGAASMRRDSAHCGRDLFGFTKRWLQKHWEEIPDLILGVDSWDIGLAAIIRHHRGIASTLENISYDFFPCETTDRLLLHENHPPSWHVQGYDHEPATKHNRKLFRQWAKDFQPQMPFNQDNVIS